MSELVKVYGDSNEKYQEQFAIFGDKKNDDGKYIHRLLLSRTWDKDLPKMLTILLNPSTADQFDLNVKNVKLY